MTDVKIHVDVHHATLDTVVDLYGSGVTGLISDNLRTVIARVGNVTLFFDDAVKAHDFATELHAGVEAIWVERARARNASPAPEN